jgi:hypothetical protein
MDLFENDLFNDDNYYYNRASAYPHVNPISYEQAPEK